MATIFNTVIIHNVFINVHHNKISGGKNNFTGIVINNYALPFDDSERSVDDRDTIIVHSSYADLEASLRQRLLLAERELEESRKECDVLKTGMHGQSNL